MFRKCLLVLFVELFRLIYLSLNNLIGLVHVHVLYLVNFIYISFITVYIDIDIDIDIVTFYILK